MSLHRNSRKHASFADPKRRGPAARKMCHVTRNTPTGGNRWRHQHLRRSAVDVPVARSAMNVRQHPRQWSIVTAATASAPAAPDILPLSSCPDHSCGFWLANPRSMSDSARAATRPHVLSAESAAPRCSHGAAPAPRWPASGPGASMIRAGSERRRMSGHRARSRGMCLPRIQESFHEDVSEHSALSKRSLQLTSHLTRTRTGSAGTEQSPSSQRFHGRPLSSTLFQRQHTSAASASASAV
jgi:hypothetical protein